LQAGFFHGWCWGWFWAFCCPPSGQGHFFKNGISRCFLHYLACDLPGEAVQKQNAHQMWNNGQGYQAYGDLNLRTWYQSDLALRHRSATSRSQGNVVYFTDQAMTKHYFIAGAALSPSKRQRIASKLAESFASEVVQNIKGRPIAPLSGEVTKLGTIMTERLRRDFECLGIDYNAFYPGEVKLEALETLLNAPEQPDEYQVFFYHSDHLGSSSFITDVNGDATQHLQYLPFGEDLVHEQNTAAYLSPYTFSGKERDVETNLSYFGARYYEAGLSVWLSVDPMSYKYPSLSAYNYCALNPVMLVDPDGRDIIIWYKQNGKLNHYRYTGGSTSHPNPFVQKVAEAWNYNVGNGGGYPSLEAATNRSITINVVESEGNSFHLYGTVYWNPELGSQSDEGIVRSPASVLDHELDHAVQGKVNPNQFNEDRTPNNDKQYDTKEERRVITGSEQKTALANKEIKKGQVTRTNHGGKTVITNGVTSTTINKQKTTDYVKKQQQRQVPSTE
jgi:RHS repeat-associated protein